MSAEATAPASPIGPLWGELRYSSELLRLLADGRLRIPRRRRGAPPVLLIPGFMAGDASLRVMRTWLGRRGHHVAGSGMVVNVDCAGRIVDRLELELRALVAREGRAAVVIGQSRGGALARALAVRAPEAVAGLAMLGSPVRDSLAVSAPVLRTVRLMAWLGDLRVPGVFSHECEGGECCADFRAQLRAPLARSISVLSVHSRSDAIVDWRACIDDHGRQAEVDSSHCGMSVHPDVYRELDRLLEEVEAG